MKARHEIRSGEGSGNNRGSVLVGFLIWFLYVEAEPIGNNVLASATSGTADDSMIKAQMRLITIWVILLFVLRFYPKGLIPERAG